MQDIQNRIKAAIIEGALNCSTAFERVANADMSLSLWDACKMPESWIQMSVMQSVAKAGFAAIPEVAANNDFKQFVIDRCELVAPGELRRAKIDLFVGHVEQHDGNTIMRLLSAIEIKGKQSRWETFGNDLKRLGYLRRNWGESFSRFLVYVSPPKTASEFCEECDKFKRAVGLMQSEFEIYKSDIRSCRGEEAFSYVFFVEC